MAEDRTHEDDIQVQRFNWELWRSILRFVRPYAPHLAAVIGCGVTVASCEVLMPRLLGLAIDDIGANGPAAALSRWAALYAVVIVAMAGAICGFIVFAGRITTAVSYDIREACFDKLQELPFSFYDRKAVGWLMARLTSDCSQLSRIIAWGMLDIAWGTFMLCGVTGLMLALNWQLAVLVLCIVPALLIVSRYFSLRLLITSRLLRRANSHTTAAFNEGIVGVRTSKSMVREDRNLEEFSQLTGAMYGHSMRNAVYSALFFPAVSTICGIGVGLALGRGGLSVLGGSLTLGTLVTFIQYAQTLSFPIEELARTLTNIQGAQASAERIQGLLDTEVDIRDSRQVRALLAEYADTRSPGQAIDGGPERIERIEFRNVSFAYKEGQKVLDNFSLTVDAGQSIALVGPTGGGKTTIVGLACRFYEPTEGQILINGTDYRQRSLRWLQSSLGMVLQQPHLFSGTIRQNIRYGRLEATDADVEEAARMVNAHEFILGMKDGYDTQVGEGGNRLSTGQKQLIALARAVLARPRIFVMDEATSSVDTQTERAIQSAVERVLSGRISFVIAHRLSTIRSADRILVIDAGRIVEEGNHHDLILRRGRYYRLYTEQFTDEKEAEVLEAEDKTVDAQA